MEYTPEEELYIQQQRGLLPPPLPLSLKDPELMMALLNLKEQTIKPLLHSWSGEVETSPGVWTKKPELAVMNERGIFWCINEMDGFLNATFMMSNFDENSMNWQMRKEGRVVWNGVCKQFEDFQLKKIDIPKVCWGIILKCHAVLLMARGEGTRRFLQTTHQISESRNTQMQQAQRKGLFGVFKPKQQEPTRGYDQ